MGKLIRICAVFFSVLGISAATYWWQTTQYPIVWEQSQFHLDEYQVVLSTNIEGIGQELSGLTYSPANGFLYGVTDFPAQIVEFTTNGQVIRRIRLENFSDTEGITHIDGSQFAVTEEDQLRVAVVTISAENVIRDADYFIKLDQLERGDARKGPEGIAWMNGMLLVANEQKPALISIHNLNGTAQTDQQAITELPIKDLAGLFSPPDSERLLVLSDESRVILEVDLNGRVYSQIRLSDGLLHLNYLMEQPEGIAMDEQGTLYVVGEPNQLLVLRKPKANK